MIVLALYEYVKNVAVSYMRLEFYFSCLLGCDSGIPM
jgi:hypothetical protein